MKKLQFAACLLAIVALTTSTVVGQETENTNIEHEHLKSVEAIVGTWVMSGTDEETKNQWEYKVVLSWSESKKMICGEDFKRDAEDGEDISKAEWKSVINRGIVWNAKSKSIEETALHSKKGQVWTLRFKLIGDGKFTKHPVADSNPDSGTRDIMVETTPDSLILYHTNIKNTVGESLPDLTVKLKRI